MFAESLSQEVLMNGRPRRAGLISLLVGAIGSLGFLFRAGRQSSQFVVLLIAMWVISPYIALVLADAVSKHWSIPTRRTLYGAMLILALGSLAIYLDDAVRAPRAKAAAIFVAVPLASWLLIAVAIPVAALMSRRLARRNSKDD